MADSETLALSDDAPATSAVPAEPVRLVVWDLDETFWRGTLTEGGITEYVQAHHDIIIELANRGIMSSICSKNNHDEVTEILRERGILDYIIFPSISWEPKGMRLARLIETIGLRPPTVMFIDDNPNNLAEARAVVPGIQLENEGFIPQILDDWRFKGKDDRGHTRLRQYKTLEQRKRDEISASQGGDNAAFLRGCDIRLYVESDIEKYADRAVELINRTNQLNFTKKRLSEDPETARAQLIEQCAHATVQAGLIRVVDKYGDYGFVGFFMLRNRRTDPTPGLANQTLVHYCWSCRTLGMLVEHWFYTYLRKPELTVVGEVLTDLTVERDIDWVRRVTSLDETATAEAAIAPEIRVLGGCEANSVGHFLGAYSGSVRVTGNFAASGLFIRVNSAALLLSAINHAGPEFDAEMETIGLSPALLGGDYFKDAAPGTLFVFSGAFDGAPLSQQRYVHREKGWEIKVGLLFNPFDFVNVKESEIIKMESRGTEQQNLAKIVRHVRAHYRSVPAALSASLEPVMTALVEMLPPACKLVLLLDDERSRTRRGDLQPMPQTSRYNARIRQFAARYPFVGVVSFTDCIENEDEIQSGGNHYDRTVYWRAAEKISAVARTLPVKPG